jgi:hypothetical protein
LKYRFEWDDELVLDIDQDQVRRRAEVEAGRITSETEICK